MSVYFSLGADKVGLDSWTKRPEELRTWRRAVNTYADSFETKQQSSVFWGVTKIPALVVGRLHQATQGEVAGENGSAGGWGAQDEPGVAESGEQALEEAEREANCEDTGEEVNGQARGRLRPAQVAIADSLSGRDVTIDMQRTVATWFDGPTLNLHPP